MGAEVWMRATMDAAQMGEDLEGEEESEVPGEVIIGLEKPEARM